MARDSSLEKTGKSLRKKVATDLPLSEITLRKYERPYDLSKRGLIKKLCLSMGLLNPGESRDVVIDILYVLMEKRKFRKEMKLEEIRDEVIALRDREKQPQAGIAASNIRRQLRRLREAFLIDKIKNRYRITEYGSLKHIFEEKIEKYMLSSTMDRVKEYLHEADTRFE